ncbi:DUF4259 domain-containing protein [Deinococcus wulumuqiensis]|uniref:DUF4259 domain-containing protein n=1 Tax=Deinococcus wulumuqiensis TaxID=980427 RepID=UPI00242F164D|nr:DUF4259 domain-containing protein [Deinococcus wulumuqiensis]
MNLWGTGPFDNDSGKAFIDEVLQDGDYALAEAFDVVLDADMDFIEAEEGQRVMAAAEILNAVLTGDTSRLVDAELRGWVQGADAPALASLKTSARNALARVMGEHSDLPGLWEDGEDAEVWLGEAQRLRQALS